MKRLIMLVGLVACSGGASAPEVPPVPTVFETVLTVQDVKGCNRCAMEARAAVRASSGVRRVKVDIATGEVRVIHLTEQLTAEVLHQSLEDQGHPNSVVSSTAWVKPEGDEASDEAPVQAPDEAPVEAPAADATAPPDDPQQHEGG